MVRVSLPSILCHHTRTKRCQFRLSSRRRQRLHRCNRPRNRRRAKRRFSLLQSRQHLTHLLYNRRLNLRPFSMSNPRLHSTPQHREHWSPAYQACMRPPLRTRLNTKSHQRLAPIRLRPQYHRCMRPRLHLALRQRKHPWLRQRRHLSTVALHRHLHTNPRRRHLCPRKVLMSQNNQVRVSRPLL